MSAGEYDVLLVSTFAEADALGARRVNGVLRLDGRRVISTAQHPNALDGLRVGDVEYTGKAAASGGFSQAYSMLRRAATKGVPKDD